MGFVFRVNSHEGYVAEISLKGKDKIYVCTRLRQMLTKAVTDSTHSTRVMRRQFPTQHEYFHICF